MNTKGLELRKNERKNERTETRLTDMHEQRHRSTRNEHMSRYMIKERHDNGHTDIMKGNTAN